MGMKAIKANKTESILSSLISQKQKKILEAPNNAGVLYCKFSFHHLQMTFYCAIHYRLNYTILDNSDVIEVGFLHSIYSP